MSELYFTRNGIRNLEDEISAHDEKVRDLLKQLGEACADDPDLPENYLSKEIRGRFHQEIPAEKQRLLGMRAAAVIVENSEEFLTKPKDIVWIGSEVKYCAVDDKGDVSTFTIMGALESDIPNSVISYEAPLAAAMIGKKAGDTFKIDNGRDKFFEIISVRRVLDEEQK